MRPKIIIISFTVIIGTVLSFYIVGQESKGTNEIDSQVGQKSEPVAQVPNRGEPIVTLKPDYIQIGRLQAKVPKDWEKEQPSSSMRIAQFRFPGNDGDGELVIFSGIGGSIDANLNRWYGQFKSETENSVSESAIRSNSQIKDMDVTFSYVEGTYLKSSMGMGGTKTEMPNYALLAAIVSTPDGLYYFKGTGPKSTMDSHKVNFEIFIRSIMPL